MTLRVLVCAAALATSLVATPSAGQTADADAANRLFQAGAWAGAAAAYEALVAAHPGDGQMRFRLGVALQSLGRLPDAAAALETAERLGGPSPAAAWRLAQVYARLRRADDAFAALTRATTAGFASLSQFDGDPDIKGLDAERLDAIRKKIDRNARPCVYAAEYRQLDFWIGDWDVGPTGGAGPGPSRSRIELVEDQCVIFENYSTPGGYSGRSLNSYHPDKQHWEQFWVDNTGAIHHYVGQFRDGNLYYEAEGVRAAGPSSPPARAKMTFFDQGPDQVRQLGEQSVDEGKTWTTTYDLTYRRRKTREPACPVDADPRAVSAVRAAATGLVGADNARAIERVMGFYSADAVLMPPNEPPLIGRDRIRPRYEALFASATPAIEARIDEVCVSGPSAFVRGHNGGRMVARDGGADRVLDDAFLMLLIRQPDQTWRISHLMWH